MIRCRGWLSTVCTAHSGRRCRVGRTRTRPNECCIGPRQRRPCTSPPLPQKALGCSGHVDPAYARTLLEAARTAYHAARRHPHLIAPDDHARFGGGPYADDELEDDFYWAAVELWLTTDEEFYRQEVLSSAQHAADAFDLAGFDFDRVTAPARLDLALAGQPPR